MQINMNPSQDNPADNLRSRLFQWKAALGSAGRWHLLQAAFSVLVRSLFRGRSGAALIDQIMISGSNFVASIILVRGLGLHEFGKYAIALALLLYANASQMSFITSPMLTIAPLMDGKEKRHFVDGMFLIQICASVLVFVIFVLVGTLSWLFTTFYTLPTVISFAFCVGFFQLQDWVRRYYYLYNKGKLVILTDFVSYFVQLVALFVLWRTGALNLFRTFVVMAITSLAGFTVGLITETFRPTKAHLQMAWARCRGLARDLLIVNQVQWFGTQGVLLVGACTVGTVAAGGLRATLSLAGPANLLLTSLENVVPIRISEELKTGGTAAAYKYVVRVTIGAAALFTLLLLPVGIFGRTILRVLYGPVMVAFYLPMLLQLVVVVARTVAIESFYFFRGLHDARALLRASALSAISSVGTIYFFGHFWQASGIVLCSLLGQVVIIVYFIFYWIHHRHELLLRFPPGGPVKANPGEMVYKSNVQEITCEVSAD